MSDQARTSAPTPAVRHPDRRATREHRALLALARITPPSSLAEIPGDIDWSRMTGYALEHNLAPLLYVHLRDLKGREGSKTNGSRSDSCGSDVMRALERDYYFSLAWSSALHAAFDDLTATLVERRIDWLPLKGVLFARSLYRSPELRPMTDADLLVRARDLESVDAVLREKGFSRIVPPARRATHEEMFERHYTRSSAVFKIEVEPHTGLGQPARFRVDVPGLWERSVLVSRYGVVGWPDGTRALSPEDNLLHLCLHQANSVFDEIDLRSVLDLHELIVQWRPDWELVLEGAGRWRVMTAMYLALGAARELLGTPVPDRVIAESRPGGLRRRWLRLWIDSEGLGLYRYAAHPAWFKRLVAGFGTMDRISDVLRYGISYAGLRIRDVLSRRP